MKVNYLLILLALCSLFCCKTETISETTDDKSIPSFDEEQELAEIEILRDRFELAIKEKRYQDLGPMATADFIGIGPASEEWKEYQRQREEPMGMFSYDSIIMSPKETVIVNDTMAYDYGTSKVYYTNSDGTSVELQDTFMVLLKKENGQWKMYRELASGTVK